MAQTDYTALADEVLLEKSQSGDNAAMDCLINRYTGFVRLKARGYFLTGADREDIIQEGMIGLFKAIRDYKSNKQSSFKSFAQLCITRQIISAVKSATRQKHLPLNSYVSLNKPVGSENEMSLGDVINIQSITNPEEIMINKEQFNSIGEQLVAKLSSLERKVLSLYLQGKSYQEIGVILEKEPKSIDNALQRMKRKIEQVLKELA